MALIAHYKLDGDATDNVKLNLNPNPIIVSFTTVGTTTWTVPSNVSSVDVLLVAGGGGGGDDMGGGGGGGGVLFTTLAVTSRTSMSVVVGGGGAGSPGPYASSPVSGSTGGNSSFGGVTALGGGGGGSGHRTDAPYVGGPATVGGSGGGAATRYIYGGAGQTLGAAGTAGQGFAGGASLAANSGDYYGGGGGGAGNLGGNAVASITSGNGGGGALIPQMSPCYFGGGGGAGSHGGKGGNGGLGGGGGGSTWYINGGVPNGVGLGGTGGITNGANGAQVAGGVAGGAGGANTGGGGGGGNHQGPGGAGGSGIVIIRYYTSALDGWWNGTATYTTGKIGQAGSFNGSSTVSFPNVPEVKPTTEVSVSLFFNATIIADNDYLILVGRDNSNGYALRVANNSLSCWVGSSSASVAISANTTYHTTLTYKSGVGIQLYLNGVLAATGSNIGNIPYNEVYGGPAIGGHGASLYYFNGWIDDVKIYNHAISLKEVKELYKAKILHYKFDQLEEYTTNVAPYPLDNWTGSSFYSLAYGFYDANGTWVRTLQAMSGNPINSPYVMRNYLGTTGYKYFSIQVTGLTVGAYYTFSYYARIVEPTSGTTLNLNQLWRDSYDKSAAGLDPTFTNQWTRYSATYTVDQTTLNFFPIHGGAVTGGFTLDLCGFQLEQKDHATPFVNGTRADVITDCSGYGNNGALDINSPIWSSNPKLGLGYSSGFTNNSTKILPSISSFGTLTEVTVSCWIKTIAQTGYQQLFVALADEGANRFNIHYSWTGTMYWDFGNASGVGRLSVSHTTDNNWHLWTYTAGASGMIIYKDGVSIASNANTANTFNASGKTLCVGMNNGSSYLNGSLDDFRIYAKQLTQSDITELYQTRANVDTQGALTAQSFSEDVMQGILNRWTMSSTSGTTIYDKMGVTNISMIAGSTVVTIPRGKGINIPVGGYLTSPSILGSNLSFSFWCNTVDSGTWRTFICRDVGTYHHMLVQAGTKLIGFYNGGWNSSGYVMQDSTTYHIVITISGSNWTLCVNGVFVTTLSGFFDSTVYPMNIIGNYSSASPTQGINGWISDVRTYNRILTSAEANQIYTMPINSQLGLQSTGNYMASEFCEV